MSAPAPAINPPVSNPSAALLGQLQLEARVSEPYYLQLQRQIEALVRSGALPAGTGLPSERDLAEMLNISRSTAKRGYDELRRARLLVSKGRRSGTVVQGVPHVVPAMRDLKGFSDNKQELDGMQELGHMSSTRVLERAIVSDRMVASMFNRTSEGEFLRLVRLRLADGVPMSREIAWYDLGLAPKLANWPGEDSAYAFLREQCGLNPTWATQSIEAVTSSKEEVAAFGFAAPAPCLLLKRQTFTADNQQVEYVEGTFRGDAYRYQIKLDL
ncbi:MAG: GntR family transcriptional regulator [Burkholderiaceae bacterium]|jgi:GntR family transcriptional regulator|nr:GntR family transcriptional regulator [Burkholderiaceae bacterium]